MELVIFSVLAWLTTVVAVICASESRWTWAAFSAQTVNVGYIILLYIGS
jgi:hypothetical protein